MKASVAVGQACHLYAGAGGGPALGGPRASRPAAPLLQSHVSVSVSIRQVMGPSTDGRISVRRMIHLMLGCVQVRVRRPSWSKSPQTFAQDGCVCAARSKNEHARETDSPAHEVSCTDLTSQGSRVPESRDPSPQQSQSALESTYVIEESAGVASDRGILLSFAYVVPEKKYISGNQKLCKCQLK